MKKLFYFPFLFVALLLSIGCEREWNNPWDNNADIDLQLNSVYIKTITISSAEISWSVSSVSKGVKMDKKINDEPWVKEYATIKDVYYYIDDDLNTSENSYQYRLYAFNGTDTSKSQTITYDIACGFDSFVDPRDGLTYKTTQIGRHCWFAENLRYLPEVFDPYNMSYEESRYYVYGYNGANTNDAKSTDEYNSYGVLYNLTSARTACPEQQGWHLPKPSNWQQLVNHAGGESTAGNQLKEVGFDHWNETNTAANDVFGFSARGGGLLNQTPEFVDIKDYAHFISVNTEIFNDYKIYTLQAENGFTDINTASPIFGYSIRCIKKR